MKWVAIAVVACALLGLGVAKRDWIIRRLQHAPATRVRLGFDHPAPPDVLERARQLVELRMLSSASVRIDGGEIVVELEPDPLTRVHVRDLRDFLARPPRIELRVVDTDPAYVKRLVRKRGFDDLPISEKDGYLVAEDRDRRVNEAWAKRHGCTAKRQEYYGLHCTLTGRDAFEALVHGDDDIGVAPLPDDLAVPADRELLFSRLVDDRTWRTYLVETRALGLGARELGAVAHGRGRDVTVALTPEGASAIAGFASGTVAVVVDGEVRATAETATIAAQDRITLPEDVSDTVELARFSEPLHLLGVSEF
jgi:hypothetical protein